MFTVRAFEAKTLSWWYGERENLDLAPVYQRRSGLWSKEDKAFLIDSILNHFDVPKIYVADFTFVNTSLNRRKKSYAVIDGKQRLEAIFDFFDGTLFLSPNFVYFSDPSLKLAGLGYKDLKATYPKVASDFEQFNLSVMSVITDEEDKINEMFVRLNRSKPLTGAEIRSAMHGQVPLLIRRLVQHSFFKTRIRFVVRRKQDYNAAAKLLLIEFRGKFVDTKKIHLDRFVQEGLLSESTDFESATKRVETILNQMYETFNQNDPLLRYPGLLNVYYWLFRTHYVKKGKRIREFLVEFDRQRKDNKKRRVSNESNADPDILLFENYARNPNDQSGMVGSYGILEKRFTFFESAHL